jgi:hypothetical protein
MPVPFHSQRSETFEKWLRRGSKSFSIGMRVPLGTDFKSVPKRKTFDSPLGKHFSAVMQISNTGLIITD